jgi:hypothetical protein
VILGLYPTVSLRRKVSIDANSVTLWKLQACIHLNGSAAR